MTDKIKEGIITMRVKRLSWFIGFLIVPAIISFLTLCPSSTFAEMGGMTMGGGMREMMHRMMPDLLPPGVKPEDLPDPDSKGAKLLVRYCIQCHNLPSPAMHTAEQWPAIMNRMMRRMAGMGGMMNTAFPSPEDEKTMVNYLKAHSLKSIHPTKLPSHGSVGAGLFRDACSQCHPLPDPKIHTAKEWPEIVKKMRVYMETMNKKVITIRQEDEIVKYLSAYARTQKVH